MKKFLLSILMLFTLFVITYDVKSQSVSDVKDTVITLSSLDIVSSNVNPVEVLPELSSGYTYSVIDAMCKYDYQGTIYSGGTTLRLYSNPGINKPYPTPIATTQAVLQSTSNTIKKMAMAAGIGSGTQYIEGASVIFRTDTAAIGGNGTLTLYITYQIIEL